VANQNFKVKKGLEVGTGVTISDGNINISGILTATQFAGDGSALTGVTASGTGVVVQEEGSNIGTAATINFIGSNVTAALSGGIANVTVAGGGDVVTDTTPQLGGNLDLNSKNITGTGNISITGGFNATGVSTFQENVVFQSTASFGDNDKINVGAGNDLQIFHDGTSNIISDAVGAGISLVGNTKVVGVLTATSFSGSLATTDLTGTITNAQLAGSIADGKLASTFLKNVVEDTTPQLGGDLDGNGKQITGIGTISLDVLSVAGLSTFRNTVLLDGNTKLDFYSSTSQEGQIYATSEYFYINSSADNGVFVQTNGFIELKKGSGSDKYIEMNSHPNHNGEVSLYYDGSKKLETTNTGVSVTGTLAATAVTGDGSGLTDLTGASAGTYGASTNTPIITVDSNGRITGIATVATSGAGGGGGISNIIEDTTPQLGGNLDLNSKTINGTGNIDITGYAAVSGVTTFSGTAGFGTHITLPDHAEIQVGNATGGDLRIYHNANDSFIRDSGTGGLYLTGNIVGIKNAAANETGLLFTENGAVQLYHDNALRLTTTDAGVSITDNLSVAGISTFTGNVILNANLDLQDNDKILLGSGDDLQVYHNGTDSYVQDAGTGSLILSGSRVIVKNAADNEKMIDATEDGAVELYHNNVKKFETTSSGVTVTGTLAATAVTGDGSGLTGLPAAGITTANTNIQATWAVTSNGASAYRFTGPGNDAADDNPDLYLVRGQRYRFTNNSGGSHPFQIRSSPGGSAYSTGVTNNGGASGNIDFNVQHDAPERLYYQCTSHSGMVGNIYIVGGSDWRMTDVNTSTAPEIYTTRSVGIGTVNPTNLLHIDGGTDQLKLSDGTGSFEFRAGNILKIKDNGTERLRIDSDGAVNIGSNPAQATGTNTQNAILTVKGYPAGETSAAILALVRGNNTTSTVANHTMGRIVFSDKQAGEYAFIEGEAEANGAVGDTPGRLVFSTAPDNTSAPTEKLRITSGGDLYVGTTTPYDAFSSSRLYLEGYLCSARDDTTVADGNGIGGIRFYSNDTNINSGNYLQVGGISCDADGDFLSGDAPTRLTFSTMTDGTTTLAERFRIDSSGRVSIGQTVSLADYNAFTNGLVVKRGGINEGITIDCSNQGGLFFSNGTGSGEFKGQLIYYHTTNDHSMRMLVNGGEKLRIKQDGDVKINNGNLLLGTAGNGISFINAADTATGETVSSSVLDDYEEGFFTPIVADGMNNISYGYAAGRYIKIGRQVVVDFYMSFNNTSTGNGSHIRIGGLPYIISNDTYGSPGPTATLTRGGGTTSYQDWVVSDGMISFYGSANSNTFYTYKGSSSSWATSASAVGKYIIGQYIYHTD